MLPQRLLPPAVALATTVVIGVVGYWLMGHGAWSLTDCAYMTITTVSTVGFGEILPISQVPFGRPFTMVLVLGGVVSLWWFLATVTAVLVEGEVRGLRWRRRMDSQLKRMQDHIIVCGAGSTGIHCVRELSTLGVPFAVVDRNPDVLREVTGAHGGAAVAGDATHDEILEEAGIGRARGIISALTDDKDNLFVAITARALNPRLRIVAKAIDVKAEAKLKRAGADSVVSPNVMGGLRMVSEMVRPEVTSFLDVMLRNKEQPLRLAEIAVPSASPWAGKPLAELDLASKGLLLLAIRDPVAEGGRFTYSPTPDAVVSGGSILILLGAPDKVRSLSTEAASG
ncbi:MAG TPA: potassium channel protein [Anaeromyxobacteraceae bacterium]|nr:potassium channel protein [Anaeromyxobacteraceae bacterium]